ncbi:MAG: hypothetical protein GY765_41845 [bacterium]|nr:hypothetical protein [bacterium]
MTTEKPDTNKVSYFPPPVTPGHVKGILDPGVNRDYPCRFDLREHKRITPVEDQGKTRNCWLHATTASLESNLMPHEEVNYSEAQMNLVSGFDAPPGTGGNYYMAAAILARWAGPVRESDYDHHGNPAGKVKIDRYIQQVVFLPNRSDFLDNNTIKYFLTHFGAIYADVHKKKDYYWAKNHSYYCNQKAPVNHAVSLIGWDDNYPAENFETPAPGNGAFIIKNSYGTEFGDKGFFLLSYYDFSFRVGASFHNAQNTAEYVRNYQYDPLGHTGNTGFMDVVGWAANVFKAKDNFPLKAVAFYTNDANVEIDILIYKNVSPGSPTAGEKAVEKKVKKIYPGYYTEELDTLVDLEEGELFSVVLRYQNSTYRCPIPEERPIANFSSRAAANRGESFVSPDGEDWFDLASIRPNANVCIKAFTATR